MSDILQGDCLQVLQSLPENSVQCCVTSPPYYGLRSYLPDGHEDKPLEIGLEETPHEYITTLVRVFREVLRVLRNDGTLWLNIGDSYAGGKTAHAAGLKPKDLMMIPARLALALQDDGWYLRSDIIWHKPSAMPESVTDRPTNDYEHVFLLAKSERYYYDAQAIAEPTTQPAGIARLTAQHKADAGGFTTNGHGLSTLGTNQGASTRNKRAVWSITSQPYNEAHFATFPPKLIEPCILAGTSPQACEDCTTPWRRILSAATGGSIGKAWNDHNNDWKLGNRANKLAKGGDGYTPRQTVGWEPSCTCNNTGSGACVVLDPFMGAGTVALVAIQQHRQYIGVELNPEYIELANKRIAHVQTTLWSDGGAA